MFGELGHGRRGAGDVVQMPTAAEGAGMVVGVAGGLRHSLVVRESGEVVAFGVGGQEVDEDEDEEQGSESHRGPVIEVDGRLGLGAEVAEALRPTVVPGVRAGNGSANGARR